MGQELIKPFTLVKVAIQQYKNTPLKLKLAQVKNSVAVKNQKLKQPTHYTDAVKLFHYWILFIHVLTY